MTVNRPQSTGLRANAVRGDLLMAAFLSFCAAGLCGCLNYLPPEKLPYARLAIPYAATQLRTSTTLDVLNVAHAPAYQFGKDKTDEVLLTQSDTVIAFSGRSDHERKSWLNMIVFDEFRLTAVRKYFFLIDEQAEIAPTQQKHYLFPPRKGILFDSQFIIDPEVLTTPYATEEAQKIAIIQWITEQFENDMAALIGDPKDPARGTAMVQLCGMMVGQMFTGLLVELDKSPGLVANLGDARGIAFPHISLGKGRIQMLTDNDVATMKTRVNLPMVPFQD